MFYYIRLLEILRSLLKSYSPYHLLSIPPPPGSAICNSQSSHDVNHKYVVKSIINNKAFPTFTSSFFCLCFSVQVPCATSKERTKLNDKYLKFLA